MKKYVHVFLAVAISVFMGCSTEKSKQNQEALADARPQAEVKKSIETPMTTQTGIVSDRFTLVASVAGFILDLSVDTDLPDNAVVMVRVSRTYLEKGNSAEYDVDYFSEKSTIGKWKSKHSISIGLGDLKTALRAKQEKMTKIGLGFNVASISDKIRVRMIVPINQPNTKFGDRNQNLTGQAVNTEGIRVVENEIEIDHPLNLPGVDIKGNKKNWLNPGIKQSIQKTSPQQSTSKTRPRPRKIFPIVTMFEYKMFSKKSSDFKEFLTFPI